MYAYTNLFNHSPHIILPHECAFHNIILIDDFLSFE